LELPRTLNYNVDTVVPPRDISGISGFLRTVTGTPSTRSLPCFSSTISTTRPEFDAVQKSVEQSIGGILLYGLHNSGEPRSNLPSHVDNYLLEILPGHVVPKRKFAYPPQSR